MTNHQEPPAQHRAPRKRSSRVAMSDVARAAGVSKQTVSNVLRAPDRVSPATVDRVRRADADLDYHPKPAPQRLSFRRPHVIGYTVHPDDGFTTERPLVGFLDEFVTGLVSAASAADYGVLVTAAAPERELDKYHEIIASHRVDAVVLSQTVPGDERAELLARHQFPFVAFGRTRPGLPQTWVDIDNKAAMSSVVDHLVDRGRRHIAYIGSGSAHVLPWVRQRREGFLAQLDKHGLAPSSTAEIDDSNAIESLVHEALLTEPSVDAIVTDT